MRGDLSILTELQKGMNVKGRACRTLKRKYKINKDNIIKETVKQKMQLKAQRLRKYEQRKETITVDDVPSIEEVEDLTNWLNG